MVVCGPTATGKSALALALARHFGGRLVGADSMQVYRGLVIGTAALTPQQAGGVEQYLVGVVPPTASYSVADWLKEAQEAIDGILAKGKLPVVCGGTGLYIHSLVQGIRYSDEKPDTSLRDALYRKWEEEGAAVLRARLATLDSDRAAALHQNDKKRIVRALEQVMATGSRATEREKNSRRLPPPYRTLCMGLNYASRVTLYAACNRRVDAMMAEGLLEEAREVWENRSSYRTAAQAIGYKEFFPYFEESATLADCVLRLKQATRHYAKRQLTWFGRMTEIQWLEAGRPETLEKAIALVENFLDD